MKKQEKEEYRSYIIDLYNNWLEKEDNRSISYGELAFFENMSKRELEKYEKELIKELNLEYIDRSQEYYDLKYN